MRKAASPRGRAAAWAALALAGVLGITPLLPPSSAGGTADVSAFSADRAMNLVDAIGQQPRPIGSPANREARDLILMQLRSLGLEPELQTVVVADYYGKPQDLVEVVNVLARIPGSASTGAVALVGHYDTIPESPGANDDAAAVAAILESARALLAGNRLRNDVILVLTDGEEPAPRFGSEAFVGEHAWANDVGFVVNLEAIGSTGPSVVVGFGAQGHAAINRYAESVPHPAAFSHLTAIAELIGGSNTDLAPFRENGVPGLEMAYLHGSTIYHTAADTPDRVSLRSVQHHGTNMLALARHLGMVDLAEPVPVASMSFFTVGRTTVVRYAAVWDLLIAVIGVAVLVVAVRRRGNWRVVLPAMLATIGVVFGSAVGAVALWWPLALARNTMGVVESYLYLAGLIVLITGIGRVVARRAHGNGRPRDPASVAGVWLGFGLLAAMAAPGIGYLFVWPALVAGIVLLTGALRVPTQMWSPVGLAVVGATALVLHIPAIDTLFQLAQPRPGNTDSQILFTIAVPALLIALIAELIGALRLDSATA